MVEPKRSFQPDFRAGVPLSPGDTKSIVLIVSSFIATSFAGFFIEVSLHSRLDPFVLEVILFVIASIWGAAGIALWHFHKITFPTAIVLLLVNFAAIFASGTLGLPEVKKSAPSPPLTARDYFDKYINQLAGLPRFPWPPPSPSASVSFSTSLLRSHSYSLYDLQMQIISPSDPPDIWRIRSIMCHMVLLLLHGLNKLMSNAHRWIVRTGGTLASSLG